MTARAPAGRRRPASASRSRTPTWSSSRSLRASRASPTSARRPAPRWTSSAPPGVGREARRPPTPLYVVHRHRQGHLGPALLREDAPRRARAAPRSSSATPPRRDYLARRRGRRSARGASNPHLVADRGDGIRGSTRQPGQGQRAVTHVEAIASACAGHVRAASGWRPGARTRSASISPSAAHPLVGETVYIRDLLRAGRYPAARAAPDAARGDAGFAHPVDGEPLDFAAEPPPAFVAVARPTARRGATRCLNEPSARATGTRGGVR